MRLMPSVNKQIVVKLAVFATTILLMLGVGEVVCRIQSRATRNRILAGRDPKDLVTRAAPLPLGYRLKTDQPGFTNAAGFRDLPRLLVKPSGNFRIAVIGDSVTMQGDLPFEHLYVRHLQRMFDAELPGRIELLNFGITGYCIVQEEALLEKEVLEYAPDLVLWQFHDNDGQHPLYSSGLAAYYYRPTSCLASHVANKLEHYFCKVKAERRLGRPSGGDLRNLLCRWESIETSFKRVAARLDSLGVGLFVFLYPTWPEGNDWSNYEREGFDLHRQLHESLDALGVNVVDLLPIFERVDPGEYRGDPKDPWHPNAKGHLLIAEKLFPSLKATVLTSERFQRLEDLKYPDTHQSSVK